MQVRVWDINPVIANLNWIRRKNFVLFLLRSGFLPSSQDSDKITFGPAVEGGEEDLKSSIDIDGDLETVTDFNIEKETYSVVEEINSNSNVIVCNIEEEKEKEKEKILNCRVLFRLQSKVFEDNSLCRILASYLWVKGVQEFIWRLCENSMERKLSFIFISCARYFLIYYCI